MSKLLRGAWLFLPLLCAMAAKAFWPKPAQLLESWLLGPADGPTAAAFAELCAAVADGGVISCWELLRHGIS